MDMTNLVAVLFLYLMIVWKRAVKPISYIISRLIFFLFFVGCGWASTGTGALAPTCRYAVKLRERVSVPSIVSSVADP